MGYRAIKMKVGWRGTTLRDDAERVRVVRETIGPGLKLMVDANHAWRADEAIRFGRMIEQYDIYWLEEPVQHTDLRGGAEVCAALDIPVATGEMETTRWGFRQMLEARALDICQADPVNCGGYTEWKKIAALSTAHHLPLAPHGTEFIGQHCVGALPEALIVETYPGPVQPRPVPRTARHKGRLHRPARGARPRPRDRQGEARPAGRSVSGSTSSRARSAGRRRGC